MRVRSLDGLRGLASLVVAIHHALLCFAPLSLVYFAPPEVRQGSASWWLGFTPLHAVWAGGEAVYLFFVLSGLVLARPWLRETSATWRAYFLKRLPRIYLPVWASVAFALATMWGVKRSPTSTSAWLGIHRAKISRAQLLNDLLLVRDTAGWSNGNLWSLRWEMVFSLSLPFWVMFARILRKWHGHAVGLLLALFLAAMPYTDGSWTAYRHYLAIMLVGVALATMRNLLPHRLLVGLQTRSGALGSGLAIISLVTWRWTRLGLGLSGPTSWRVYVLALDQITVLVGTTLAIVLTIECPSWRSMFERPWLQYLGSRSYSLYLVHEPVVIAYSYSRGGRPGLTGLVLVALPMALLVSEVFFRFIEQPSLRFARRLAAHIVAKPDPTLQPRTSASLSVGGETDPSSS